MQACLADPDKFMQVSDAKMLKDGNTCTVMRVEIDGRFYVIKRYNIKNFFHGLMRAFRRSRAAISWRNACCLTSWHLGVVKPVALLKKDLGLCVVKLILFQNILRALICSEYFEMPFQNDEVELVVKNMNELFGSLARVRVSHGDLKATNVLLTENKPILLDLDAMRIHHYFRLWSRANRRD